MAIVKNSFKVSKLDGGLSPVPTSTDEDDGVISSSSEAEENGVGASEVDSGMGSDEFELSELGEAGTELCQVGNQSCGIPLELYELPALGDVLSLETWNDCLSEEDRYALSAYLPDMDQETFGLTLYELFSGANFHFGSPLADLFGKLKGGQCAPTVVLYRCGLHSFRRRKHYHMLREYHNSMVGNLVRVKDVWQRCAGAGIEEKLRLLNVTRSNGMLGRKGDVVGFETDSKSEDSVERVCKKKMKIWKPSLESVRLKPREYGKENQKGVLKVAATSSLAKPGFLGVEREFPLGKRKVGKKSSSTATPQQERVGGYGTEGVHSIRDQMMMEDDIWNDFDEQDYASGSRGRWDSVKGRLLKPGKKQEFLKKHDRQSPVPFRDKDQDDSEQKVTIASYGPYSHDMKVAKYSEKDLVYHAKGQVVKGAYVNWSDAAQQLHQSKAHGGTMALGLQGDFDDRSIRRKKQMEGSEFKSSRSKTETDRKLLSSTTHPDQMDDLYVHSNQRGKPLQEVFKSKYVGNGVMEHLRSSSIYAQSEETESDSSEEAEEDEEFNIQGRRVGCRIARSVYDHKKANEVGDKIHSALVVGGLSISPPASEAYSRKGRQKGRARESKYLENTKFQKGGSLQPYEKNLAERLPKSHSAEKNRKGLQSDHSLLLSDYMHDHDSCTVDGHEEDFEGSNKVLSGHTQTNMLGNRMRVSNNHTPDADYSERVNMHLSGCNSMTKKRKGKLDGIHPDETNDAVYVHSSPRKHIDDSNNVKKKGKKYADAGAGSLAAVNPEPVMSEQGTLDMEQETKLQKKPFTLITPTVHTGFSFSIVHLLSAVRKALITPHMEDTTGICSHVDQDEGRSKQKIEQINVTANIVNGKFPTSVDNMDLDAPEPSSQKNLPSLTVQEIVSRVKRNPLDPCILETQEPLHDLVRGVLKIFSSKTAPLGAKGWKALILYEKSNKSWSWIGPVSSSQSENDTVEEETSSEAWGIPHKMLVKLVDAFANWLKSGQETLQQIGSLPPAPVMPPCLDEKERFRDLRAQKSLSTISLSSDEVKAYFRREEFLRYSVPDRAFSYTAADGKKSIVAPLRRGGGKPTSKARDHFLLKPDRPPHVTILCLVRDAAARLPGSIGTRADVCTLIRDSQYIVEGVSDTQVNQIVSGALDRLHYERDPCVQYDQDRKLWVYLHRDREEEDFEDDGTSSTKKWKRQKKEPSEQSDVGAVNDVGYHAGIDPAIGVPSTGDDLSTGLNDGSSSIQMEEKTELVYDDLRPSMDNIQTFIDSTSGSRSQNNMVSWGLLGMNPFRENKLVCQKNSTNEDF